MIVVSDASALNYLVLIDCIGVLPVLFKDVHTPPQVIAELLHIRAPQLVKDWATTPPSWLHVTQAVNLMMTTAKLGAGECHAIALAKQLHADRVLIDERDATKYALEVGLRVIGTLAVLELAADQGLLLLPDAITRLQKTSFRISNALISAALQRDAFRQKKPQQ